MFEYVYLWSYPHGRSPSCHPKRFPHVLDSPGAHQQSRPQSRTDRTMGDSRAVLRTLPPPSPIVMWCAGKKLSVPRSPNVPTSLPRNVDPSASQQSSTSSNPFLRAISQMTSRSHGLPRVWGTMIARVFGDSAASICAGSILHVSSSQSTNTGIKPLWTSGATVVRNVTAGVITSSPGASGSPICPDTRAMTAVKLVEGPEVTRAQAGAREDFLLQVF